MGAKMENRSKSVQVYLSEIAERVRAVLPPGKDPGVFLATVSEYFTRNPELFRCQRDSLDDALLDAAMLGLELGPPWELAEILPFKDKRHGGALVASLVVQYRGFMVQAYRTGRVLSFEARAVYAADEFKYRLGREPILEHVPALGPDRGALVHAYAIAWLSGGSSAMEVIGRHEADRARKDSPTGDRPGSLWKTRAAEMWQKTALKKLINRLPRIETATVNGSGTDPPGEYVELLNAVCVSPKLFKRALRELMVSPPVDLDSCRTVLACMRKLYKAEQTQKPHN